MADSQGADSQVPANHASHARVEHAGDDAHAHDDRGGDPAMGPVDVRAWGALAVGIAFGLVVVLALVQSLT